VPSGAWYHREPEESMKSIWGRSALLAGIPAGPTVDISLPISECGISEDDSRTFIAVELMEGAKSQYATLKCPVGADFLREPDPQKNFAANGQA
jgi:hypothetical protein